MVYKALPPHIILSNSHTLKCYCFLLKGVETGWEGANYLTQVRA